jgi:CRISPR-associated protein Csx17
MSYLKALGVFRLVAEQADPSACGCWRGGIFVLETTLDRAGLTKFFLEQYKPTPIIAPWNGGSGFYDGGTAPLEAICASTNPTLAEYRNSITTIRGFVPEKKPKDEEKESLLVSCRAALSDEVVPWLDVCFVLGEEGPGYFPLLGTGANDGRLDFTNNFMQRLADVIAFATDGPQPSASTGWLASALFADDPTLTTFEKAAVGQFNPGGIGGPNGVQGHFEASSRVNPWDFVLMIEGALLFAGSVARRLGANTGDRAVFPFTVNSVAVGYGSATASEETTDSSRAELWLPLWDEPAVFAEVRQLFAEGRAQVNRRQAKNAVEFALAVNLLGVSRGVTAFTRYGFLKRNGLAFLATPLGRVAVTPRPAARLLDDPHLRDWVENLRRACRDKDRTPIRYQTSLRDIDRAIFEFATRAQLDQEGERAALIPVLCAVGRAERTLARGLRFSTENRLSPLQGLNPEWLLLCSCTEAWREFRLAASLASVLGEPGTEGAVGSFRTHLEEVGKKPGQVRWSPGSTSAVWSEAPLVQNLVRVLLRRWIDSERAGMNGFCLRARRTASLADVVAFLTSAGGLRETLLSDLLWAMIGIDWSNGEWFTNNRDRLREAFRVPTPLVTPPEFAALRLVLQSVPLVNQEGKWRVAERDQTPTITTTGVIEPFHRLTRGSGLHSAIIYAVEAAGNRLHADQFANVFGPRRRLRPDHAFDPMRLAAATLFPLSSPDLSCLAELIADVRVSAT